MRTRQLGIQVTYYIKAYTSISDFERIRGVVAVAVVEMLRKPKRAAVTLGHHRLLSVQRFVEISNASAIFFPIIHKWIALLCIELNDGATLESPSRESL